MVTISTLYARVVEDIPLEVSARVDADTQHISGIVIRVSDAPIDFAGKTEMLFQVTWTVHDKNGQSGEIFVIHSFAVEAEGH
jgi:hypothetical protein